MADKHVVNAFLAYLATNWSQTPVVGPDDAGAGNPGSSERLTLEFDASVQTQTSMAPYGTAAAWEETGRAILTLVTRPNKDRAANDDIKDDLMDLFRAKRFDDVCTEDLVSTDETVNGLRYVTVEVAYTYYFVK